MKNWYFILLLCAGLTVSAGNDDKVKTRSRTVTGKVLDISGESVAGAKIIINETGETFFANLDGVFSLTLKTDLIYTISFDTIGFARQKLSSAQLGSFSEVTLTDL